MHLRASMAAAVFLLLSALPAAATTEGFSSTDVNLRTGPDTAYPAIDLIPAGDPLIIYGCLSDWSWCDVEWYGIRGWIAADYVETDYESRRVYLPAYATLIALPVITFEFNTYWDTYYRDRYHDRRWYRDRDHWRSFWQSHDHERRDNRRAARDRSRDDRIITGTLPDRERARQGDRGERRARDSRRGRDVVRADRDRDRARDNGRQRNANVRSDRQRDRQVRENRRQRNANARSDRQRERQVRDNRGRRNANVRSDRQRERNVRQDRRQRGSGVRQDRQRRSLSFTVRLRRWAVN
jgi:uncharacterized protein YraI